MSVNEIRDFIFENYYKRIGFSSKKTAIIQWNLMKKDLQLFEIELTEKISDPSNANEHYQSFITKN